MPSRRLWTPTFCVTEEIAEPIQRVSTVASIGSLERRRGGSGLAQEVDGLTRWSRRRAFVCIHDCLGFGTFGPHGLPLGGDADALPSPRASRHAWLQADDRSFRGLDYRPVRAGARQWLRGASHRELPPIQRCLHIIGNERCQRAGELGDAGPSGLLACAYLRARPTMLSRAVHRPFRLRAVAGIPAIA